MIINIQHTIKAILIFIVFTTSVFAQETDSLFTNLKEKFSSFEYSDAIKISDVILQKKEALPKEDLIELYRIRGVSSYSVGDEKSSEESFVSILMLDSTYILDPDFNSPKIVTFFNKIKESQPQKNYSKETFIPAEQLDLKVKSLNYELRNSIVRSLVLPGWGHLYNNQTTKGTILTSVSVISLISSAYFIGDCSRKEKEYLSESDRALIPAKYDKYNSSYWLRNISVAAFMITWIYSQVDLLLFNAPVDNTFTLSGNMLKKDTYHLELHFQL